MEEYTKKYSDPILFEEASDIMDEFQLLHNIIRHDYIALLQLTEKYIGSEVEFNTLYNSSLIRLFTMIEADLYGLHRLDPYPKVKEKENFFDHFSKTFNQICTTWEKEEIKEKYFITHFAELSKIKNLRNAFIHPKTRNDLPPATVAGLERIKTAFNKYNQFMASITNQFYIGYIGDPNAIDLNRILKKKEAKGLELKSFLLKINSKNN